MSKERILEDILSSDDQRVWSSSWEVVRTWDKDVLDYLDVNVKSIHKVFDAMKSVGYFGGDRNALEYAIEKLKFYHAKPSCLCEFYQKNPYFDPKNEQSLGRVAILEKKDDLYSGTACECLVCHRTYGVKEGEYHSTFWEWSLLNLV